MKKSNKYVLFFILIIQNFTCSQVFSNDNPPIDIIKILKSGDGKSIKTAYKVNNIDEEYDVLKHLKLTAIQQKLHIIDGYFIDEITTKSKTIYFKIIEKKLPTKKSKLII